MTEQEIDALPAGRELDALVAERVMNRVIRWFETGDKISAFPYGSWTLKGRDAAFSDGVFSPDLEHAKAPGHKHCGSQYPAVAATGGWVPAYSTSIEAAWEVVEKLPSIFWPEVGRMDDNTWYCEIVGRGDTPPEVSQGPVARETAKTAPLAICRAALRAVAWGEATE